MSYTAEQIKAMGKRELLDVAESFEIEGMDTSTPKPERVRILTEFFSNYKGPEDDVVWEDETETESPSIDVSEETYNKVVELSEKEPEPASEKLRQAAKDLDENGFNFDKSNLEEVTKDAEEKGETGEGESEAKTKEKVNQLNTEKFKELSEIQPISGDVLDGFVEESHKVEEFALKMAAIGRINQYQPGVAFVKKDGTGKERGMIPVHKKVYDAFVAVHDGTVCDFEQINLDDFDNVEKLAVARVVKNLVDFGHVYIRSNHSSQIYFL